MYEYEINCPVTFQRSLWPGLKHVIIHITGQQNNTVICGSGSIYNNIRTRKLKKNIPAINAYEYKSHALSYNLQLKFNCIIHYTFTRG